MLPTSHLTHRMALFAVAMLFWPVVAITAPSIQAPVMTPNPINALNSTEVLFTVRVNSTPGNPAVYTNGLQLLRVSADGRKIVGVVGDLHDDGMLGDETAGDGIYSLQKVMNEAEAGEIHLRASAVSKPSKTGKLPKKANPVTSPTAVLTVLNPLVPALIGLTQTEAEQRIQSAGFTMGDISDVNRISDKTGTVVGQSPAPYTAATAGSSVDLAVVAVPPVGANEAIPANWSGRWKITKIFHDAGSNRIKRVTETTDDICPGDPIGVAQIVQIATEHPESENIDCRGESTDNSLSAACQDHIAVTTVCDADVDVSVEMALDDAETGIVGIGAWNATDSCGVLEATEQVISISGQRLGSSDGESCSSVNSFLQRFLRDMLYVGIGG